MKNRLSLLCVALVLSARMGSAADEKEKKEPPKLEMTDDEKAILDLTNKERLQKGLKPLVPHPILCKVARAHSANMVKHNKMEHELDGKKCGQRTKEGGYVFEVCGENVGHTAKGATNLQIMTKWMASKDHRENILWDEVTEIGIGIAQTAKGERYFTQLFASPLK